MRGLHWQPGGVGRRDGLQTAAAYSPTYNSISPAANGNATAGEVSAAQRILPIAYAQAAGKHRPARPLTAYLPPSEPPSFATKYLTSRCGCGRIHTIKCSEQECALPCLCREPASGASPAEQAKRLSPGSRRGERESFFRQPRTGLPPLSGRRGFPAAKRPLPKGNLGGTAT